MDISKRVIWVRMGGSVGRWDMSLFAAFWGCHGAHVICDLFFQLADLWCVLRYGVDFLI